MSSAPIATLQRCRSSKGSGRKGSKPCARCAGSGYVMAGSCECDSLPKHRNHAEASTLTSATRSDATQLDAGRDR